MKKNSRYLQHVAAMVVARMSVILCALAACASGQENHTLSCASSASGLCRTCESCCADLSEEACGACVEAQCPPPRPPDTHLHRCVADGDDECNVCSQCCEPWLGAKRDCEACVNATCVNAEQPKVEAAAPFDCQAVGTEEHPPACSTACFESCIFSAEVLDSPCI
eukprot:COSAG06_NODE_24362_length_665_cov_0.786219_1_plen_165_part_01